MGEELRSAYGLCAHFSDRNAHDCTLSPKSPDRTGGWSTQHAAARPLLKRGKGGARPQEFRISGVRVMKQVCYLLWIVGMATLVTYGWSDNIMNQVSEVMRFMGQLVAFMMV